MKITYYGHSCFGVEVSGQHLLFDPFITPNELARTVRADQVPADIILLSHAHEDHVADAVAIAKRTRAQVLSNFEIYLWLTRQGVKHTCPMNLGGTARLGSGIEARLVPALHSSSLPDGSYGGTAGGWVVRTTEGSFYYSGDTALMSDMKLIGESVTLNWAALCIGDTFTMGVEDAIRAAALVGCDQVLGVHYDTFPPIRIDHEDAKRKFQESGRTLHLPQIGETLQMPS
jgi:L-ascorbate metabolism protein UlaG (beta-lactamase superfamily)